MRDRNKKGNKNMEKFARLVFEEQVSDDAQIPEVLDRFKASLTY